MGSWLVLFCAVFALLVDTCFADAKYSVKCDSVSHVCLLWCVALPLADFYGIYLRGTHSRVGGCGNLGDCAALCRYFLFHSGFLTFFSIIAVDTFDELGFLSCLG